MAKKEKAEKPKKHSLTDKEQALVAESKGQKRFKRKDLIVATIITVVIVVALVAGSSVAAMFLGKTLKAEDVYSYSEVTAYLDSHDIAYTSNPTLAEQPDGAIANIVIGGMEIRYINGGSFKIANDFYIGKPNVIESFNHKASQEEDARDYVIIGTNSTEYIEHFKDLVE